MLYYAVKVVISALMIVAISELAKRQSTLAALLAAIPLTSLLAFVWMHIEGRPNAEVANLAGQIFWLVIPSLLLFAVLWYLLQHRVAFWLALGVAVALTGLAYVAFVPVLRKFGITL